MPIRAVDMALLFDFHQRTDYSFNPFRVGGVLSHLCEIEGFMPSVVTGSAYGGLTLGITRFTPLYQEKREGSTDLSHSLFRRCRRKEPSLTLGPDQPVIPGVAFIR